MASPAADGASVTAPTPAGASSDLRLTLRLISPASDLADFPPLVNVPVSTTIGRIKKRIEDELAARRRAPAGLRLIYRGRVLDDDGKQLQDVFGLAAIQESATQTLHLVLREIVSNTATAAGNIATNAAAEQPARFPNNAPQGPAAAQAHAYQLPQAQQAHPLGGLPAGHREAIMRQHLEAHAQALERWRLQNPAQAQALQPAQPPRDSPPVSTNADQPTTTSTAAQPQRNELSEAEIERILAAAEARTSHGLPTAGGNVAQEQGGQGTAQGNNPLAGNPEVYILSSPTGPRALLINENAAYYSPPPQPATTFGNNPWVANVIQQHNQRAQPLLGQIMHQQLHHMQLLQQLQQRHLQLHLQNYRDNQVATQQQQQQQQIQQHQQMLLAQQLQPELRLRAQRQQQQGGLQQPQPRLAPPNAPEAAAPNVLRQAGLQANAGAGFLAAMWPHIWLVARLILFIWWFTSPAASWLRWIMVVLLAAAVFVANTGMLDGVANQAWAPVRRHIDELLPGADVHGNGNGPQLGQANTAPAPQAATATAGAGSGAVPIGRAGGPEPDPAEVAARMVAARQEANGERLMALARRLERVGIMFLASLAPGIAERHVARVEEEERAARWRQQQEAEAAAAAAAAEAAALATAAAETAKEAEASETTEAMEAAEAAEAAEVAGQEATGDGNEQ